MLSWNDITNRVLPFHVSATATRRVSLFLRLMLLVALAGIRVDVALAASATTKYIKADTKIVGSIRVTDFPQEPTGPFVWCFKDKPSFVYVEWTKVMRVTFGEPVQEVLAFNWALAPSLQCSDDGSVLVAMTNNGTDLLIMRGTRTGQYKTDLPPSIDRNLNVDHMLSPDGTAIAVPFHLTFSSGDDVLRELKVLYIEGGQSFSWRDNQVLYFHPASRSLRSYDASAGRTTVVKALDRWYGDQTVSSAHIATCDRGTYVAMYRKTSNGSAGDSILISLSGDLELRPDPGKKYSARVLSEYSSISVEGHCNSLCVISSFFTMDNLRDVAMRKLAFEDGFVDYIPPGKIVNFVSPISVAPHGCLVTARQATYGKDGRILPEKHFIVALRITRSGRCKS